MLKPISNRPVKPSEDFPLWPHANGSWCAVIEGERRAFGGWANDKLGHEALTRYNAFMDARRTGRLSPFATETVTIRDVVNTYLSRQRRRAQAAEIGYRDYRDALAAIGGFVEFADRATRVALLRPSRFAEYVSVLAGRGLATSTIKRNITHVKHMFRWAFDQELIAAPPRFGSEFRAPRVARKVRKLLYSAEDLRLLLQLADLPLRAMIRLGVECGFGNTDVAALRWDEIDLDQRLISLLRHKTGIARQCAISTLLVKDLLDWKATRDKRTFPIREPDLVFSTKQGWRFVREIPSERASAPPLLIDSIAVAFDKLCRNKAKIKRPKDGRSFYSLRRTHRTWTDELRDPHAAALVMGHSFGSIAGLYVQHIDSKRLFKINDHILSTITPPEPKARRKSTAKSKTRKARKAVQQSDQTN